ncbi:hypothetical protein GK047_24500 [Paenibacillus sp. SYP-B3998]|uniref:Uncharacterized protein n=1 Tax=Paenibacillus sp. SYP-B3998 TaxID=2678564 RepID=A0A6G4A5P0_9BACL|nr:hypothetical protein [Paenibacillus sp. SYP-B3998]NEW09141.1 hypothetical protein [Paenibacillus sp. SYP-B3998]
MRLRCIDQDGRDTLGYRSTDIAGNVETLKTVNIQLAMTQIIRGMLCGKINVR